MSDCPFDFISFSCPPRGLPSGRRSGPCPRRSSLNARKSVAGRARSYAWVLALAVAPAFAQVNATSDYLARMDSDADGRVSVGEYLDWMSYAFDARDGNRDGVLSAGELPGGKGQAITRAQHRERLAATFKKQDVDRDGFLSARELAAPPQ